MLSFVDTRRFGNWSVEADWGKDRGPDPMMEYQVGWVATLETRLVVVLSHFP